MSQSDSTPNQLDLYRTMLRIRRFEEAVVEQFAEGAIPGLVHLYIGEEAVAAGVCAALKPDDMITSTHRGHGHCIAKGAVTDKMMAEIFGKATGYNRGKGGSMHLTDCSLGMLGANGIIAAGAVIASGAALAEMLRGTDRVCVCFLGDDATSNGMFHEAANLAAVKKLPLVFVCENNGYGVSLPVSEHCPVEKISDRAAGYNMPGVTTDGMDPIAVYEAVTDAVARARAGDGPSLVECLTYRFRGHMEGDAEEYRTTEEVEQWRTRDPIHTFRDRLMEESAVEKELTKIENEVEEEINVAVRFATDSPAPEPSVALEDVFAPATYSAVDTPVEERNVEGMYVTAINEALREECERDERVFLLGEDQVYPSFGATADLADEFTGRVIDTPISENAIVGAAMVGLRPVAEIMFFDFITCAMDPIVNQAAKMRYMTGGQVTLPLVVRTPGGGGLFSAGAQHTQCLEALFMHIPGLKVAVPSTTYDAKGLLKTAIRDDNPVLFIESKILYYAEGNYPEGDFLVPFGVADVKRAGADVTVVAIQSMVPIALDAAEELSAEGIDVEVIDPRTLVPLDRETILKSVEKTSRLVIVEEGVITSGVCAEIAAIVAQEGFNSLDAPIQRVATPDIPIPFGNLEAGVLPNKEKIKAAVRKVHG